MSEYYIVAGADSAGCGAAARPSENAERGRRGVVTGMIPVPERRRPC